MPRPYGCLRGIVGATHASPLHDDRRWRLGLSPAGGGVPQGRGWVFVANGGVPTPLTEARSASSAKPIPRQRGTFGVAKTKNRPMNKSSERSGG